MIFLNRHVNPLKSKSFFLFGARGVGKSTFIKHWLATQRTLVFNLLDPELEDRFLLHPDQFRQEIIAHHGQIDWIVVDEVQKCPKLLNSVHKLISENQCKFVLTGSSARRLKQRGVNLLAGRALTQVMYPFTHLELGQGFSLEDVLTYGSLPEVITSSDPLERNAFLRSYSLNYLKQEIQAEQWVRNMEPFRKFLAIASQMNGKSINYSAIAREAGVEGNTVQNYFDILEDTLLGFRLESYSRSLRKQQRLASKFYFFDLGVKRALDRTLEMKLIPGTSVYGEAFEHFIILEIFRLSQYFAPDWKMSYLQTKDGAEVDVILERPGLNDVLIEIKSKSLVTAQDGRHLELFKKDFPNAKRMILSNQLESRNMDKIYIRYWKQGIQEIFSELPAFANTMDGSLPS